MKDLDLHAHRIVFCSAEHPCSPHCLPGQEGMVLVGEWREAGKHDGLTPVAPSAGGAGAARSRLEGGWYSSTFSAKPRNASQSAADARNACLCSNRG